MAGLPPAPVDNVEAVEDESAGEVVVPARGVVVVVLEKPESKLLGTVPAMNTFKAIATDALRYARVQPDRP